MQNYLVFQPSYKYLKKIANSDHISVWKSKKLFDESIQPPAPSNNSLLPALNCISTKTRLQFDGNCLKSQTYT